MKNFLFLLLSMLSLTSWGQYKITNDSLYRVQGYLIIRTSLLQKDTNDVTKKGETITVHIDYPKFYFFKPLKSVSSTSLEDLFAVQPTASKLFLPMGLTHSPLSISFTNSDIKGYYGITPENKVLEENKVFSEMEKTTVKLKGATLKNVVYEVVYIDGLWTKIIVPYKFTNAIELGNYTTSLLDPNKKDGYEFYFLKEIKIIAYNLIFNDDSIIQLK